MNTTADAEVQRRRAALRKELIEVSCTPEMREFARRVVEANEPFRKQLENCCHWYFGPPLAR